MVQPAIEGIQSYGVVANAKHFILNNQETNRTTTSAEIDERTFFEMYMPPFEGASEAGVGSIMCSYNKINQTWSCENNATLGVDYKERAGFKGWGELVRGAQILIRSASPRAPRKPVDTGQDAHARQPCHIAHIPLRPVPLTRTRMASVSVLCCTRDCRLSCAATPAFSSIDPKLLFRPSSS